jgi:PPOX class probable F420-dependent enzyme
MDIETLAKNKYLSLTTFRKDGTPVATPVWLARDGDTIVVVTEPSAGKAKRLRNSDRVLVAPCDMRGRVREDVAAVPGTAQLQGAEGTTTSMALIRKRYGIQARLAFWRQDRKARKHPGETHVGIAIRLVGAGTSAETAPR